MFDKKSLRYGIGALVLVLLIAGSALVFAAPSDQPEFVQVTYLGEGGTYQVDAGFGFLVKSATGFKFSTKPGPTYDAVEGERIWSVYGNVQAPEPLYLEWVELGTVQAGCVVKYVQIDDDPRDGRRNSFEVNGQQVHQLEEGMSVTGTFVVQESGDLRLFANDSVGMWVDACSWVITPTPTPSPTSTSTRTPMATPSPTPTNTSTATPIPVSGLLFLPLITWGEEPPTATPSPTPTATPEPSPWLFVGCWGDPHCWNGTFPSKTVPFWQERPENSWLSQWPNGRQIALQSGSKVVEFELVKYGQYQYISAVYWGNVGETLEEIETKTGEVTQVDLDNIQIFVSESCGTFECQDPQIWWRADPEATGLLVDVFENIQRAKATNQ